VIASPEVVAWQYNVEVSSLFRFKFLFNRHPILILSMIFLVSWTGGTIVLHALEYIFEPSFAKWWFTAFDVMSGIGWSIVTPVTILGRAVAVVLATLGVLCIALLTATLCSTSELNATEAWLIRAMEHRHRAMMLIQHATSLIQRVFMVLMLRQTVRKLEADGNTVGAQIVQGRRRLLKLQGQMRGQIHIFRRARLQTAEMEVSNIKTLEGKVSSLEANVKDVQGAVSGLQGSVDTLIKELRCGGGAKETSVTHSEARNVTFADAQSEMP